MFVLRMMKRLSRLKKFEKLDMARGRSGIKRHFAEVTGFVSGPSFFSVADLMKIRDLGNRRGFGHPSSTHSSDP